MRFILEVRFANSLHLQVPTHSTVLKGIAAKVHQKLQMEFLSLACNKEVIEKNEAKKAISSCLYP